jgi:hypothetical protein
MTRMTSVFVPFTKALAAGDARTVRSLACWLP